MITLATYLHRIDPFAIHISGNFGLRWYGLSYIAGFAIAYLLVKWMAKRGLSPLEPGRVADFVFVVALGTLVGGRLGYCLFYAPDRFIDFSASTIFGAQVPMWGVLKIWDGGMASHGGVLGIVAACWWFARRHKLPALHLFDLCAVTGGLGVCFGRIANFINGELVGRKTDDGTPFAVKFPQDILDPQVWPAERLTDLAEVINTAGPAQTGVEADQWSTLVNQPDARNTVAEALERVVGLTQQAGQLPDAVAAQLEPLLDARHPSQLYQALGEGLLVFIALMLIWAVARKPGIIGCWFLVLYAAMRVAGEQFRQPDAHIAHLEFAQLGVTRGQILSFVMLSVGLALLIAWSRRAVPKVGGWLKPAPTASG